MPLSPHRNISHPAASSPKTVVSLAPGRICLFGDHQDYLGLPVIACAIDRHIKLTATENGSGKFYIQKPDIGEEQTIFTNAKIDKVAKNDHFTAALKILRKHGCIPTRGYDISIRGNLPINAGTSSSSAVVVSWVKFLLEAFGADKAVTPAFVSQTAYEAEVAEHGAPGGKMDQYSIGLGNIVYLNTGRPFSYEIIGDKLDGMIIGESGIPKQTIGLLTTLKENALSAIRLLKQSIKNFDISKAELADIKKYNHFIPDKLKPFLYAAVANHNVTKRALPEFKKKKPDITRIGELMNEHHSILKDILKITVPKIDAMVTAALNAGASGAKIVGSGGGGSIVVLATPDKKEKVVEGLLASGAKDAYAVSVDRGARILK